MIKERADELVAALRSGKYEQSTSRLRRQDAFCCLGVACDVSGLGKWRAGYGDAFWFSYVIEDLEESIALPNPVERYFGFRTPFGDLVGDDECPSLSSMNDNGKSFSEIADFIEQNWEQL